jgi:hypothetical protein
MVVLEDHEDGKNVLNPKSSQHSNTFKMFKSELSASDFFPGFNTKDSELSSEV